MDDGPGFTMHEPGRRRQFDGLSGNEPPPADDGDPGWSPDDVSENEPTRRKVNGRSSSHAGPDATGKPTGPETWSEEEEWNEADIPPRPWIAGGYFLRKSVTALIGASGISKSSLVLAWAVALATGQKFSGLRPRGSFKVVVYNVEDDADEQKRRLSAVLRSMGLTPKDVAHRIMRTGPTRVGTLLKRDPDRGFIFDTGAMAALKADMKRFEADVLFLDPLVELHDVEENDNGGMRQVIAELRATAVQMNIGVGLVHHTRKGNNAPGDAEAARGASAISGAARIVLTLAGMKEDEASSFGLPAGTEKHYFRLDGGKANYSSVLDCEWFERVPYVLDNGASTDDDPEGGIADSAAAAVPWEPPQESITPEVETKLEAAVRQGSSLGPWTPAIGEYPRSVKHAMEGIGIKTRPGQKKALDHLLAAGFTKARFKDERRKFVSGLRSPDGFPKADWEGAEDAEFL